MILSTAKRNDTWYAVLTDKKGRLAACNFSHSKRAAEQSAIESLPSSLRGDIIRSRRGSLIVNVLHRIHEGKGCDQVPGIVFPTSSTFLRRVYETTIRIPKGKVTTYATLARLAGSKRAPRAAGNAMARNPLPLIVPCHRVVPSTLKVGNYGAAGAKKSDGARIKRELLVREGVRFDGERIFERCVWDPVRRDS